MRISDWSSDVCSSDLRLPVRARRKRQYRDRGSGVHAGGDGPAHGHRHRPAAGGARDRRRGLAARGNVRIFTRREAAPGFRAGRDAGDCMMNDIVGTRMVSDGKTARQIFAEVMANTGRSKLGFGEKHAIVNVDFQHAYTRIDELKTAYETDPRKNE